MAYFDENELTDCIRHGFAIEDDSNICSSVLGVVTRKPKPGGLPIDISKGNESPEFANSTAFLWKSPSHAVQATGKLCTQNILKKAKDVRNLINARRNEKAQLTAEQIEQIFPSKSEVAATSNVSALSRLLSSTTEIEAVKFDEFAKFEAFENEAFSRTIKVIFPFSTSLDGQIVVLDIRAKGSTLIREFIGLCCFIYTRENNLPECKTPGKYSLYLAEENGEFDVELPPLDNQRPLDQCCFTVLALVDNGKSFFQSDDKYRVTVHLVNGTKFEFELENLNQSLKWLRDEAAKKREEWAEENIPIEKRQRMRPGEYILEAVDEPSQPLKLNNTISSTGTLEYLLIRKNSTRGDWKIEKEDSQGVLPLFVQTRQRPNNLKRHSLAPRPSLSPSAGGGGGTSTTPISSISFQLGMGPVLLEFNVDRIHRLKPKWPAKLILKKDCLEIVPIYMERRRAFVLSGAQKCTTIAWDLIGGVDYASKQNAKRLIRIIWLPMTADVFNLQQRFTKTARNHSFCQMETTGSRGPNQRFASLHSASGDVDSSSPSKPSTPHSRRTSVSSNDPAPDSGPSELMTAYEALNWKIVQLEAADEDAWTIGMKINEILEARMSSVRRVYQNSSGGTRRPKFAAELTFGQKMPTATAQPQTPTGTKNGPIMGGLTTSHSTGNFQRAQRKKISVNPMPMFSRMLSRE